MSRILFSLIFSTNCSQFDQMKKKTNFSLVQNSFFLKFIFSSTAPDEKKSLKKLGKTRIEVWQFDVTNKILYSFVLQDRRSPTSGIRGNGNPGVPVKNHRRIILCYLKPRPCKFLSGSLSHRRLMKIITFYIYFNQ